MRLESLKWQIKPTECAGVFLPNTDELAVERHIHTRMLDGAIVLSLKNCI